MPRKQYKNLPEDLRESNVRLIMAQFLAHDTRTIADLERAIGISKTTIIKIITQLLEHGILVSQGKAGPSEDKGRRPIVYSLNRSYKYILAVQIFPSEVYAIATDLQNTILHTVSLPVTKDIEYEALLDGIESAVHRVMEEKGLSFDDVEALTIASCGPTNYPEGILIYAPRFPNLPRQMPLKEALEQRFPATLSVIVENEMRLQALAEQNLGHSSSLNVVLEAGDKLVAGLVDNSNMQIRGQHSTAGEIGHMVLDSHSDVQCVCGAHGCFLALVSIQRVVSLAEKRLERYPQSLLHLCKKPIKITDIFDCYQQQDPLCEFLLDDVARWFGQGLANIILMFDPQSIVIQGVYTRAGERFLERIKEYTVKNQYPLLLELNTSIVFSSMGKEAGVLGGSILASKLFLEKFKI